MEKLEIARRQLGTALQLYIDDLDPVSVHSLAGNAHEIIHRLADISGTRTFRDHVSETFSGFSSKQYFNAANFFRNAFKHLDKVGDQVLIDQFDDEQNKHLLFVCWYTYGNLTSLPIEAQCFELWYFALEGERSSDKELVRDAVSYFGEMGDLPTSKQKLCLRAGIETARSDEITMSDPRTECLPLVYRND
jgi:hypothetical protein